MNKKEIITLVEDALDGFFHDYNYELVDIEYIKEGSHWYLRIFVDKQDGINIQDCEIITKYLSKILDEKDPIEHQYFLEVSSPGLERKFKKISDFKKYQGKMICVKLFKDFDNKKEFIGILDKYDDIEDSVNILIGEKFDQRLCFPKKNISSCRLFVEYSN